MAPADAPDDAVIPRIVPQQTDDLDSPQTRDEREAAKEEELKDLEREALQRPDPASDDLPDRAFDRIAPGV